MYNKYDVTPPWVVSATSTATVREHTTPVVSNVQEVPVNVPILEVDCSSDSNNESETRNLDQLVGSGQDITSLPDGVVIDLKTREGRADSFGNSTTSVPINATRRIISRSLSPPLGKTGRPSATSWKRPIEEENQFRSFSTSFYL